MKHFIIIALVLAGCQGGQTIFHSTEPVPVDLRCNENGERVPEAVSAQVVCINDTWTPACDECPVAGQVYEFADVVTVSADGYKGYLLYGFDVRHLWDVRHFKEVTIK